MVLKVLTKLSKLIKLTVSDSIEAIILTMHKEDFSMAEYHGKKSSPYIREMEGFIKRVVRDHFR